VSARSLLRLAAVVVVASLATACTTADDSGATTTGADDTTTAPTAPPVTTDVPEGDTAVLVRGLDGDSFRVEVDGSEDEVRLAGINAPEGGECYGDEARRTLLDLIEDVPLTLVRAGDEARDRFGRRLDLVYAAGLLVNAEMVRRGAAMAYHGDLAVTPDLLAATEAAWTARLGMWAPDACGPAATAPVRVTAVVADPPGRDEENANAETVQITNEGTTSLDLTGWVLRDETSSNRYTFSGDVVLSGAGSLVVHSGCGADTATDLFWCADFPVWSNGGDTVLLLDPRGNVADRVAYSGSS
jgi:endonuclease YncB( thermonuclease family)